ncbi:hypothetical protein AB4156_07055 [Cupriavidus sp. 2MCAB6]|uniref:hypothetical protein n=1 Tax=Cupriavidus sp. 2MCAB6 TaxID=3232981 RepID=UPI003F8F4DF3
MQHQLPRALVASDDGAADHKCSRDGDNRPMVPLTLVGAIAFCPAVRQRNARIAAAMTLLQQQSVLS